MEYYLHNQKRVKMAGILSIGGRNLVVVSCGCDGRHEKADNLTNFNSASLVDWPPLTKICPSSRRGITVNGGLGIYNQT